MLLYVFVERSLGWLHIRRRKRATAARVGERVI